MHHCVVLCAGMINFASDSVTLLQLARSRLQYYLNLRLSETELRWLLHITITTTTTTQNHTIELVLLVLR